MSNEILKQVQDDEGVVQDDGEVINRLPRHGVRECRTVAICLDNWLMSEIAALRLRSARNDNVGFDAGRMAVVHERHPAVRQSGCLLHAMCYVLCDVERGTSDVRRYGRQVRQ